MWPAIIAAAVLLTLVALCVAVGGFVVTQIMRDEQRYSDEWSD